jgi:hypothetical protein
MLAARLEKLSKPGDDFGEDHASFRVIKNSFCRYQNFDRFRRKSLSQRQFNAVQKVQKVLSTPSLPLADRVD